MKSDVTFEGKEMLKCHLSHIITHLYVISLKANSTTHLINVTLCNILSMLHIQTDIIYDKFFLKLINFSS